MKKLTYEMPIFYIALTENDIKANDPYNYSGDENGDANWGGGDIGAEVPEET